MICGATNCNWNSANITGSAATTAAVFNVTAATNNPQIGIQTNNCTPGYAQTTSEFLPALMCDGSTRPISSAAATQAPQDNNRVATSVNNFLAATTYNGGEILGSSW